VYVEYINKLQESLDNGKPYYIDSNLKRIYIKDYRKKNQFPKKLGVYIIHRKKEAKLIDGILYICMAWIRSGTGMTGRLSDHFGNKEKEKVE